MQVIKRCIYSDEVFVFLCVCVLGRRHTFGAFPLSTVPALLILLISGLVSWRVWEKKYEQDISNHSLEVMETIQCF